MIGTWQVLKMQLSPLRAVDKKSVKETQRTLKSTQRNWKKKKKLTWIGNSLVEPFKKKKGMEIWYVVNKVKQRAGIQDRWNSLWVSIREEKDKWEFSRMMHYKKPKYSCKSCEFLYLSSYCW